MTRNRWTWLLAYLVCAAVAVSGTVVYIQHRNARADTPQRAAEPLPALVDTAFPVSLDVFPARHSIVQGHFLEVGVQSPTAAQVQLWDGSRRFGTAAKVAHGNGASFRWPALTIGQHLLYARGINARGVAASSLVYSLDVLDPHAVHAASVVLPGQPGETAVAAATRLGVPPSDVSLTESGAAAHTPGVTVHLPAAQPVSTGAGSAVTVTPAAPAAGAGPAITLTPTDCGVTAHVAGVSGPATLAEAEAGRPGFVEAGTRQGNGDITLTHLLPGTHLLTVEDAAGRATPAEYTVPQSCAKAAGWTGDVTLIGDVLTTATPLVHGYLYAGVAGKPFQRIPADPTAFITSPSRRITLAGDMPDLVGSSLTIQAWHQSGATASEVGHGAFTPPGSGAANPGLVETVGEPDSVTLAGTDDQGASQTRTLNLAVDRKVNFAWSTDSTRPTAVVWQVLTEPISNQDTDLNPVGMLASGLATKYTGIQIGGPAVTGTFTIDTHTLSTQTNGTGGLAPRVNQTVYIRAVPVVHPPPIKHTGPPAPPVVVGTSSGSLALTLPAIPTAAPATFKLTSAQVDLGRVPNPDLADCADVTTHWANPPNTKGDPLYEGLYPRSGTYCYSDFNHLSGQCDDVFCDIEEGLSTIVDGLSDVWDLIAAAFNGLIDLAVKIFAKLNPVCLDIELADAAIKKVGAAGGSVADAASSLCGKIGAVVGRAAITAVLSSVGIPPVLPTSAQLKAIAKGDIVELGVEVLSDLGVPCDSVTLDSGEAGAVNTAAGAAGVTVPTQPDGSVSVCALALQATLGAVEGQVLGQAQDTATNYAGIPDCPTQYCSIVPSPGGRLQPVTVSIVAHRTAGVSTAGQNVNVDVSFLGDPAVPALFTGGDGVLTTTTAQPDVAQAVFTFSNPTMGYSQPGTEFQTEVENNELFTLHAGDSVTATIKGGGAGQLDPATNLYVTAHYAPRQTR